MGFLNSLGDIFRFRHAVPEHIVPYIHKPFRRGGHTQKGNLRLLEEGPHRLVFTGNQRSHHDHLFSGNEFLGRRHRLLHIALGVHHFHIHVDFSFFVDFIHRHVKAFFFRQAVGSHAAGNAVDKAYLGGLSAALSFSFPPQPESPAHAAVIIRPRPASLSPFSSPSFSFLLWMK